METPIVSFVEQYQKKIENRFHMPGHKGFHLLGYESLDITEVKGADALFEADGIIQESERNASQLFNSACTLYSTEGSSLVIRSMIYLALYYAKKNNQICRILAGRNAHKTFVMTASLLNIEVEWLMQENSYLSCTPTKEYINKLFNDLKLSNQLPTAIYLTSPDYLGNMCDIQGISEVCHKYNVLVLVDNAHGAYLHFLDTPSHPIDLGADFTSDSAHKTLPVVTGGAYLQVSKHALELYELNKEEMYRLCKNSMMVFASTSPSYLILQSLDYANKLLEESYIQDLNKYISIIDQVKLHLKQKGYLLIGNEGIKITLQTKAIGYTGIEIAEILREYKIECEFADDDYIVLMITPYNSIESIQYLENTLLSIPVKEAIPTMPPAISQYKQGMNNHEALFSEQEVIEISLSLGRILASPTIGCPPAVPIVMCGEIITQEAIQAFQYYHIDTVNVVKEKTR